MILYDVIVVGSGPSGSMAAYYLAKNGLKVAVLEKENLPRYKTCGGGLVWRGRKMLPFDIESVVKKEFNEVDLFFYGQDIHLKSKRDFPVISMVMRDDFDHFLVNEAKNSGAEIFTEQKVISVDCKNDYAEIQTDKSIFNSKYVIAADGVYSTVAKISGWTKDTRKLIPALEYEIEVGEEEWQRLSKTVRFDIDFISQGYAWSFPKKNHLSLGLFSSKRDKLDLKLHLKSYVNYLEIKQIKSEQLHGFQIPISSRTDGFMKNRVLLTGDAAGLPDPITAEGISNALLSGQIAAESIIEGQLDKENIHKIYTQKLNDNIVQEFKSAEYLANLFYNQVKIRNILIKKYGEKFCEAMTDIFSGEKRYPKNIAKTLRKKLIGI